MAPNFFPLTECQRITLNKKINFSKQIPRDDILAPTTSEELINKYVTLIDSVRVTAPEALVIVTEVPYRLSAGSREANMKADILNDYLKSLCSTSDN